MIAVTTAGWNNSDMSLVLQLIMCSQGAPAHRPRAVLVGAAAQLVIVLQDACFRWGLSVRLEVWWRTSPGPLMLTPELYDPPLDLFKVSLIHLGKQQKE